MQPVCQHYRLLKLVFGKKEMVPMLTGLVSGGIVICPTSLWTAALYDENNGIYAPWSPRLSDSGKLREIHYRLTAFDQDTCVTQDFRHKIENKLILSASGIVRKGVKLFEVDSLNLVLRTKAFPGVKCLQFVC